MKNLVVAFMRILKHSGVLILFYYQCRNHVGGGGGGYQIGGYDIGYRYRDKLDLYHRNFLRFCYGSFFNS